MVSWARDAVFYHIYPLGLVGAPEVNDFSTGAVARLEQVHGWIGHLQDLGINALYIGPLFESSEHGYDTADYYRVDRRLGTNETLVELASALHTSGIRVILDGVFHHVGRDFWAFRDLQQKGEASPYRDWFTGVDFSQKSPYGDAFTYEAWQGHFNLVKLNLHNSAVREHLFGAVERWIKQFEIDGLRLDVAEVVDPDFLRDLASLCRDLKPDFLLIGEIIHGDCRRLANPEMLDSATNYEAYKGLWSSLNDRNYFEIAYALDREFGKEGVYKDLPLYNFVDNHDVDRVASSLNKPAHLYPLYLLLFTMPGMPSIYAGSEWGMEGVSGSGSDAPLRPALASPGATAEEAPQPDLPAAIQRFAQIRHRSEALRRGDYEQLSVNHEQLAFARRTDKETVLLVINAADTPKRLKIAAPGAEGQVFVDVLNEEHRFVIKNGRIEIEEVPPCWGRILVAGH